MLLFLLSSLSSSRFSFPFLCSSFVVVVEGVSAGLLDEPTQFLHGIPAPEDQPPADGLEIGGHRSKTAAEKVLAVGAGPVMPSLPTADHVDRDDAGGLGCRLAKGRVVGDAEFPPNPDDGGLVAFAHETV